jgi:hypothetical protein
MHVDRHVDGTILTAIPWLQTHLKGDSEQHVDSQCVAFILITNHILKGSCDALWKKSIYDCSSCAE